jgi:hypothetical protein
MCFGPEVAEYVQTLRVGCLMVVLNPKLMKPNSDTVKNGNQFSLDSPAQLEIVGYS